MLDNVEIFAFSKKKFLNLLNCSFLNLFDKFENVHLFGLKKFTLLTSSIFELNFCVWDFVFSALFLFILPSKFAPISILCYGMVPHADHFYFITHKISNLYPTHKSPKLLIVQLMCIFQPFEKCSWPRFSGNGTTNCFGWAFQVKIEIFACKILL